MYHTTPFQNMFFMGFSVFILLLSVVIIIVGIILIHDLPYHIAQRRNHPQQDAIRCMAVMGLVLFPLWLLSMVWAFMRSEVSYAGPKHPKCSSKVDDNVKSDEPADVSVKESQEELDAPDLNTDDSKNSDVGIKDSLSKAEKSIEEETEKTEKSQTQE